MRLYFSGFGLLSGFLLTNLNFQLRIFIIYSLQDALLGISNPEVVIADGKIRCSFIRDAVISFDPPNGGETVTIDLDKMQYFLELATGPLGADGNIAPHQDQEVSKNAFQF